MYEGLKDHRKYLAIIMKYIPEIHSRRRAPGVPRAAPGCHWKIKFNRHHIIVYLSLCQPYLRGNRLIAPWLLIKPIEPRLNMNKWNLSVGERTGVKLTTSLVTLMWTRA